MLKEWSELIVTKISSKKYIDTFTFQTLYFFLGMRITYQVTWRHIACKNSKINYFNPSNP